ncbi:MAG: AarF/ABC1/UbiB kinase family protein [Anaerolineaceae bacterium]|nr:AarF/ABC1/UbiB kinase family protein [Anaerolineaceae bacterium]
MLRTRYRRILWFFARVLLSLLWWDILLPHIGLRSLSNRNRPARMKRIAVSFRALAVQMGGVMIKVGQFLSARLDVLPREITDELSGLQDEVSAERFEDIRRVVESEFNRPLDELFAEFDPQPLASASIGQVHTARLRRAENPAGVDVVVKVQRPMIEAIVDVDLAAFRVVARWVDKYPPIRKRMDMPSLMEEFSRSLLEEIDYLREGKNAETFAENFANRTDIRVPLVYWSHTSRRVLCLERIRAIKITDYEAIDSAGISRAEVAERLFDTYLQQIFEDRFFHADPHPGNLFVLPLDNPDEPGAWQLIFVDFGMTGTLNETMLKGLTEVLIALGLQDAARLVKAYSTMHVLLPGADVEAIQAASAEAFSRFWGRTAPELAGMGREEIMKWASQFADILYELPFQVPEDFILLFRCVGILSGICSGLNTDFNIWTQVTPYATKLVESQRSGGVEMIVREAGDLLRVLVSMPRRAENLINRLEQGKLSVQTPDLGRQVGRLDRSVRRMAGAVVFAAFFLGAVQLYGGGYTTPAYVALGAALLSLAWTAFSR